MNRMMRRLLVALPAAWLVLFFGLPFALILQVSLSRAVIGQPPFTPLFAGGAFQGGLGNFALLLEDDLYLEAILASLGLAAGATGACILLGYPMAWAIAGAPRRWRAPLLALVALPFVTSFLIRVYAWIGLLRPTGSLSVLLQSLGLIDGPLALMPGTFAVAIGMTYTYLPFMVLPIYASLEKIDPTLASAAADLGARPGRIFWSVTLPLSAPGVLAGSLFVFVPAVGEFVVPELLGGPGTPMIGKVIWQEFFNNRDWPLAAALAVVLLVLLAGPIALAQRSQAPTARGLG
ncbi:MAG: ABC transporter permease subunit [Alphaproteobacteria bacterium]|nr:ABC transporter permease subunit [Alphaproteobacteria bacterium]